jgi:hypothetical protein
MRSELDVYWDQISDKVSPRSVRGHVLEELGITPGSDQALHINKPGGLSTFEDQAVDIPLSEIDFIKAVRDLKDLRVISDEVADDAAWDGVLQRIKDDGDADDALYDIAKAEYDENPYYQYFDESGHGYSITGSDDVGFTLETPSGETSHHGELSEAQGAAIDHAHENDLVSYDTHGGEFTPEYMGYTMAGSKSQNYRELLFKFPNPTDPYRYGHFTDDFAEGFTSRDLGEATESDLISPENVGAHVRVSDLSFKGKKGNVLALDEAQSDLHKKVRLAGGGYGPPIYRRSTAKEEAKLKEANESIEKMFHSASELSDQQLVEASPLFRALIADLKATPDGTRVVSMNMRSSNTPEGTETIGLNAYAAILDALVRRENISDRLLTKMNPANLTADIPLHGAEEIPVLSPEGNKLLFEYRSAVGARDNLNKQINEIQGSGRPDMPFKSMDERGWPRTVILSLLRKAVDEGYDYFAWTPGTVQVQRYNAPRDLYDKTIPKIVNKFIKKFDPSMKIDENPASDFGLYLPETLEGDTFLVPHIKITDKMRDSLKRLGQAIMTLTGGVGLAEMTQDQEQPQAQ